MPTAAPVDVQDEVQVLQCMDLWSGNHSVENCAATPGLELFVFSEPYQGDVTGGDVHYVSLCAGGIVTRLVLADVSGHGSAVDETSQMLRGLMRRFMNSKSQTGLVNGLNREFTQMTMLGRFATAIVATYLNHKRRFSIINAGHPRPLWYRAASNGWSYVDQQLVESGNASNLPLGIDDTASYEQLALDTAEGDIILFYTDALTEAPGPGGDLLGERGLLDLVQRQPTADVRQFARGLLSGVRGLSSGPATDDMTFLAIRFTSRPRRQIGSREKLKAYAKMLRLKPV